MYDAFVLHLAKRGKWTLTLTGKKIVTCSSECLRTKI